MKWYLWGNTEQRPRCGVDTSSIAAKLLAMSPERREHTLRLPIYLEESGLTGDLHRLLSASVERSTAAVKSVQGISRLIGNDRKAQFEQIPVDNLWYGLWRDAGNVGGFVEDLTRAWRLSERTAQESNRDIQESREPGLEFRYALMLTSVNSVARNFPPLLVAELVRRGEWSAEQALTFAQHMPDSVSAARTLRAIASFCNTDQWEKAVAFARMLSQEREKAEALVGLAPYCPAKLRSDFIEEVRTVVKEIRGNQRLELLGFLVDSVGDPQALKLLEQQIDQMRGDHDTDTLKALIDIVPLLPRRMWPKVLSRALRLVPKWDYFVPRHQDAAAALRNSIVYIARLDKTSAGPLFESALIIAATMDEHRGDAAVTVIARYTPIELVPKVKEAVRACDSYQRWRGLANLAIRLGEVGDPLGGCSVAREIQDTDRQTVALAKLSVCLSKRERELILSKATELKYEPDRVQALLALEPHLKKRLRERALSVAKEAISKTVSSVFYAEDAIEFFTDVAPIWPEKLALEAIAAAVRLDGQSRAKSLIGLGSVVPESLLDDIVVALQALASTDDIALVSSKIIHRLNTRQLQNLVVSLQRIGDNNTLLATAVAFASWSPDDLLPKVKTFTGYKEINPIADEELSFLVAHLLQMGRTTAAVNTIRIRQKADRYSDYGFVEAVESVAPNVDPGQLKEFVCVFREPWARHKILVAGTVARTEKELQVLLSEAIREARRIVDPRERVQALARIVECAPKQVDSATLHELRRTAEHVQGVALRWEAVAPALRYLPSDWGACLTEQAIDTTLLALLSPEREETIFDSYRDQLIEQLGKLAENAKMLGCQQTLSICVSAIDKVKNEAARAKLIAGLVPHVDSQLLDRMNRVAGSITDDYRRGSAQVAIVTRMAQLGKGLQALREARSIYFHSQQPRAIGQVARLLPAEILAEISVEERRHSEVGAGVAVGLAKAGLGDSALSMVAQIYDEWQRCLALQEIIPLLSEDLAKEAVRSALDAVRNYAPRERARTLIGLLPIVPRSVRTAVVLEVFSAAYKVRDQQVSALGKLFGEKPDEGAVLLRTVTPYLKEIPHQSLHTAWGKFLHSVTNRTREAFLLDARTLAPVLATVGGPKAVEEAVAAILDVGKWWP